MILVTLAATLAPGSGPGACPALSLWCGDRAGVDFVLNALLFLPLGATLGAGFPRAGAAVLVPAGLSFGVELLQATGLVARDPSLRDLIANTLGGALGLAIGHRWRPLLAPTHRTAFRVAAGWSIGLAAVLFGAGRLLAPSLPESLWYGQWAPVLGQFDRFDGTLISAALAGEPLPSGPIEDTPRFRTIALARGAGLGAVTVPGQVAPERVASIASVFDGDQRQIALLGRQGQDLVFGARIVGQDYGFQGVMIRLRGAFAEAAGDTLRLEGELAGGTLRARARRKGGRGWWGADTEVADRLSPADGWRLLLPRAIALTPRAGQLAAGFLVMLLFIPAGWYGWRSRSLGVIGLAVAPFLVVVAPVGGAGWAPWVEWVGAAVGWGVGVVGARAKVQR